MTTRKIPSAQSAQSLRQAVLAPWTRWTRDTPLCVLEVPGVWSLQSTFFCGDQTYAQLVPYKRRNDKTVNRVVAPIERVRHLEQAARP